MSQMDLGGTWRVTWSEGMHGWSHEPHFKPEDLPRYLEVPVPMELHRALEKSGLIPDPNLGLNSLTARWVEEQYWQYYTEFSAPEAILNGMTCWLVFGQLDLSAGIYLNGEKIGSHANAHRPCRLDITGKLVPGLNRLVVLIESGLYAVADREGGAYHRGLDTALVKRHWLRKPQYQFGWDWNPRLVNVGITGPVCLEWAETARIDQVVVWSELASDFTKATLHVRAFVEGLPGAESVSWKVRVKETGQEITMPVKLSPGMQKLETTIEINNPRLWWPVGQGEPALYTIEVIIEAGGKTVAGGMRRTGIRKVRINRDKHPVRGEYFIFEINDRPVFCKGGNWVPADMLYSTVDRKRLQDLVDLALAANFNLLRIWGGGLYAGHDLLELCDEAGLLVWQDLPFACSKYPSDYPEFLAEVRTEITWAAREYASHPSLIVWCGNNEQEVGAFSWGYDKFGKSLPDYALYHHAIPVILREEDPMRPYWPSSPYSADHIYPNEPTCGDQHPWDVSLGPDGPDFWAYRNYVDSFPDEGGVLGAVSPATLKQFLPQDQRSLRSFAWEHHDNAVNFWHAKPGVTYLTTELWLGRSYNDLGFEDYVFGSALLQAEGLTEYITNYRRRMFTTAAAIFWMYNDSWPVTHGWTIVDYYLRKKLSFHPVRRAFQPVTVVVTHEDKKIKIYGVNDSPVAWQGILRSGVLNLQGGLPVDMTAAVTLPANTSTVLMEMEEAQLLSSGIKTHGAFALLTDEKGTVIAQHRLFLERFKDLALERKPEIKVVRENGCVVLTAPVFVWGVCLDLDGESGVTDNCFDLLPGVEYRVADQGGEVKVLRTGNGLVRG